MTLGTMFYPYSTTFFCHALTASLVFGAFLMIFILGETPEKNRKPVYFILIGLLLGWALITEFPSAFLILGLVIYYFIKIYSNRRYKIWPNILFPIIGAAIPILLQLTYNKLCFGGFFSFSYAHEYVSTFQENHSQGLLGISLPALRPLYYMTIHPSMGLFWESPFLLLAFVGLFPIVKSNRKKTELIFSILLISLYILIISGGRDIWWGGAAFGARHILPILLFFSIPLSYLPKRLNWVLIVLGIFSIGQMVLIASTAVEMHAQVDWSWSTVNLQFFEYSQIYDYALQHFLAGDLNSNIGNYIFGLDSWMSLIPFFVVLIAGTCIFFRQDIRLLFLEKAEE